MRSLIRLAVPSAVSVVLTNAYRSVDQFWLQYLSTDAQAAIGSLAFVLIGGFAFFAIASVGAAPLIARATGAEDPGSVRSVFGTGLTLAIGISVTLSITGLIWGHWIPPMLGLEGAPAILCQQYLDAFLWTLLPLAITPLVDQAFVATGDTKTPMLLQGHSLSLNICLTPFFVFPEVQGIPSLDLGIAGAALASNLSRFLSTAIGVYIFARRTELSWADLRFDENIARIVRIGTPAGLGIFLYAAVYWGLLHTCVSPLGAHVNAALGIGFSALEGFTWPIFHGISVAIGSIVGRSLGAGRPDLAYRSVTIGMPLILIMGLAATAAFYFGAEPLASLFTDDPQVLEAATEYAVVLAFSQLFVALESLAEGVLVGAGDTKTVFWTSVPLNILRIPLAWALAFPIGWGAAGIWWAINYTTWAKSLLKLWFVRSGGWSKLEV